MKNAERVRKRAEMLGQNHSERFWSQVRNCRETEKSFRVFWQNKGGFLVTETLTVKK